MKPIESKSKLNSSIEQIETLVWERTRKLVLNQISHQTWDQALTQVLTQVSNQISIIKFKIRGQIEEDDF